MKILFCGDVFAETEKQIHISDKFKSIINNCEFSCINLEGPLSAPALKKSPKRGPSLMNAQSVAHTLKNMGFNVASLANNHIMDYGKEGLFNTIELLNGEGFQITGAGNNFEEAYRYLVLENDVKVGILSVAEKQFGACIDDEPGFAWMYKREVYSRIRDAREECDAVIILCHCGAEGINVPLPEVRELYRQFIDMGADCVIGNHPHVIQGSEEYKDKIVFYSLGNFIWDTADNIETGSESIGVCLEIDKNGSMNNYVYEIKYRNGYLDIVENNEYRLAMNELKDEDKYISKINEFCKKYYVDDLRFFYGQIIGFDIYNEQKQRIFIKHRENGDPLKWDDLMVYHNAAIETNRWIAERAIRLLY